ncbi:FAD-dependent oxidoreductase [Geminicoccaceae bacterium 1502E]|nr:FAD-dependent oxidoreductase [Geminicoccaceae bacterium 1502E]
MSEHIVIVGGGQAGLSCAARLRDRGFAGELTLLGEEPCLPYQRPPLSKAYLLGRMEVARLSLRSSAFYEKAGIRLVTGRKALRIDRAAGRLELVDGDNLAYDRLVLATGSRARLLPASVGGSLEGVFALRTLADADRMRDALLRAEQVLVVGGGYVGLEIASVCAGNGARVTVVELADRILKRVASAETAALVEAVHRERGVTILTGTGIERLEGEGGVFRRALLTDGTSIAADAAVIGIGGLANDELAAGAGLAVDNGVLVDEACRTADPAILAVGDCAAFPYQGARIRLESVQNATDQATAAADTLMGAAVRYRPVPWFWSDQYDVKLQTAGLPLGHDQTVTLPGERPGSAAVWYFRAGIAIAVDTLNDARTHMAARRLFGSGGRLTPADLADPAFDLREHTRAAGALAS